MPRKKTTEEKTVAAVSAINTAEKTASVTEKPKRKYTRKSAVKETAPKADKKLPVAESVKEPSASTTNKEVEKKTTAKEDKSKRKYTRKSAAPKAQKKASETKKSAKKNDTAPASTSSFILQYGGAEYDIERIKESVVADCKGKIKGKIKSLDIYVKPEEHAVYYVINGKDSFRIDL